MLAIETGPAPGVVPCGVCRCQLCGEPVQLQAVVPDFFAPTLDHILPLSLGGKHEPSNVQLAHFICNARKSNRLDTGVGDDLKKILPTDTAQLLARAGSA